MSADRGSFSVEGLSMEGRAMISGGLPRIRSGAAFDPFGWLEKDADEASCWRRAQSEKAERMVSGAGQSDALSGQLRDALSYATRGVPIGRPGRYFFLCSAEGAERSSLWLSADPSEDGRPIADPADFDQAEGLAEFGAFWPSFDGEHVILAVTRGGRQGTELVVIRVADRGEVSVLERLPSPTFAWAVWHDDRSFFWSRRAGDIQVLSLRRLDGEDTVVSLPIDTTRSGVVPIVSDDRQWLLIITFVPGQPGCRLHAAINAACPALVELEGFDREDLALGWWAENAFIFVAKAKGGREVISVDLSPLRSGRPPTSHTLYNDQSGKLTGACALPGGNVLLVDRAADGGNSFRHLSVSGAIDNLKTHDGIAFGDWAVDRATGRILANFQQWDAPARLVAFLPQSREFTILRDSPLRIPLSSTRTLVVGEDGVGIPVTIIRAAGRQEERPVPCLLWGYGGFGLSITPACMMSLTPWLEAGGMVAVAHVRGGGEMGPAWHEAGRGPNKRVSFADMIRVARWLADEGYTSAGRLCLWGTSAGGLLVLGTAVLAPDICSAVIAENPVTDLANFTKFQDDGIYWTVEFGDTANDPAALALAAEWSPLHNLKVGQEYPATLILVGGNDERVSPVHGRKMTAALQASGSRGPHLLLEKAGAGHGGHATVSETARTRAELLSFAAWRTGLRLAPAAD